MLKSIILQTENSKICRREQWYIVSLLQCVHKITLIA
jgi:hypothetical protein